MSAFCSRIHCLGLASHAVRTIVFAFILATLPGVASAQLTEIIGGDELGHCPPKGGEIGTGPTDWTQDVDKDGDGKPDYRWNKEYTDSCGNVVRVYCLSKGGWRFGLTYDNKLVGICPYESGCNLGTIKRATPGGKIKSTEWSSKDGEYSDKDDDGDKDKDEMKYIYDVATNQLQSVNCEGGTAVPGASSGGPPPTLGDGTLPPSWGTPENPTIVRAVSNGSAVSAGCECATVAHWTFDEGFGNTLVDHSRNGNNDGAVVGATWALGLCDGALMFDGIDDNVTIPHSDDLVISEGTIEFLFRPSGGFATSDPAEELLQKDGLGIADGDTRFYLGSVGAGSGRFVAHAEDLIAVHEIVSDAFPTGWIDWWYHVAYVFDASGMRLYVNKVLQSSSDTFSPTWFDNVRNLVIGYDLVGGGNAFHGWIDEIRIANAALPPSEFLDCPSIPVNVPVSPPKLDMTAYPNPFNPFANIVYVTAVRDFVVVRVYDVRGRLVKSLIEETQDPGEHVIKWDGRDQGGDLLPSGIYFVRIESGGESRTRKTVIMR